MIKGANHFLNSMTDGASVLEQKNRRRSYTLVVLRTRFTRLLDSVLEHKYAKQITSLGRSLHHATIITTCHEGDRALITLLKPQHMQHAASGAIFRCAKLQWAYQFNKHRLTVQMPTTKTFQNSYQLDPAAQKTTHRIIPLLWIVD